VKKEVLENLVNTHLEQETRGKNWGLSNKTSFTVVIYLLLNKLAHLLRQTFAKLSRVGFRPYSQVIERGQEYFTAINKVAYCAKL
jgi:hypothetical protein